ncbi:MAG: GIY-YIG nuclease family protein [Anaerolineae bacterium]|jgi:Uri superfamily endonuclease
MLPEQPGTYALILRLSQGTTISVGSLGEFNFPAGWYAYAGSARGPGGLDARVSRHIRESKGLHWHIDYLRAHAEPAAVWYDTGHARRECTWASALSQVPGTSSPAPRFGASDCRCPAHLIHLPRRPAHSTFEGLVDGSISRFVLIG